ncbi:MAG: hypothetical protein H6810_06825 [Phycisphaeraceae bacterium]|nr:MAG: hypothetical protein H6810_06825 [Phycisphaeraceae bacterium]
MDTDPQAWPSRIGRVAARWGAGLWSVAPPRVAAALTTLAFAAAEVAAQQQRLVPPKNEDGIKGKPWLTGFVMLVLLAVVLVGAFLKSKRGHQD